MTEHSDDNGFERYLDGEGRVSRSYARLKEMQPPESLDRAILDMARKEASKSDTSWRSSPWNRWLSSLSIAAVVTLTLALVLRVELEPDRAYESMQSAREMPISLETDALSIDELAIMESDLKAVSSADVADAQVMPDSGRTSITSNFTNEPVAAAREKAEASGQLLADSSASKPQVAVMTNEDLDDARKRMVARGMAPEESEIQQVVVTGNRIQGADPDGQSSAAEDQEMFAMYSVNGSEEKSADGDTIDGLVSLRDDARAERKVFLQSVRENPVFANEIYNSPEDWLADIDLLLEEGSTDAARDEIEVFRLAYPEFELEKRYVL